MTKYARDPARAGLNAKKNKTPQQIKDDLAQYRRLYRADKPGWNKMYMKKYNDTDKGRASRKRAYEKRKLMRSKKTTVVEASQ